MGRQNEPLISALALERPGAWRWVLGLSISILLLAPMAPLFFKAFQALPEGGLSVWVGESFLRSLMSSAVTGLFFSVTSLSLGLPLGALAAAYAFPGRSVFLMLLAMPLLIPSFLWAIALSDLSMALGLSSDSFLSGSTGTVLSFVPTGLALVMIAARAGAGSMTQSQADALRLAGGETLFLRFLQAGWPPHSQAS
jgi:ABC-type Fe3+ transport system permease subunit